MSKQFEYPDDFLALLAGLKKPTREPSLFDTLFPPSSRIPFMPSADPPSPEVVSGIMASLAGLSKPVAESSLFNTLFPLSGNVPLDSLVDPASPEVSRGIAAALAALGGSPQLSLPVYGGRPAPYLSSLQEDLQQDIRKIFKETWSARDGQVVPEPKDLGLGNDAVNLDATVLYADMADSTQLVNNYKPHFAAEIYKTYLASAARIIKDHGGVITAYDGDRVMGIFIGDSKDTRSVKAALKINWAVDKLINPAIGEQYPNNSYRMKHVIGIDTSRLFASRIGVRNDNDIVWVGRAANYAAKLSSLNDGYPSYVTGDVYDKLDENGKFGGNPRRAMWEQRTWTAMGGMRIYRSNWIWPL